MNAMQATDAEGTTKTRRPVARFAHAMLHDNGPTACTLARTGLAGNRQTSRPLDAIGVPTVRLGHRVG